MVKADTLTADINAEVLGDYKFSETSVNFLLEELEDEELTDNVEESLMVSSIYESALLQSIVLHTLETVRGASDRDLLNDMTIKELITIIYTDVGLII
tara:strand:- start:638 stop:931 length:294 start_codon:yes stop_codon:yes gene_type:complete